MKREIYKGAKKTLYYTSDPDKLILSFTDNLKISNNKIIELSGKGVINNCISAYIMERLSLAGIDNHFVKKLNMREQLIKPAEVFPISICVTNIACDRYVTNFKMEEGYVFESPMIEYYVSNRELNYPLINEYQIINFGWLYKEEVKELKRIAIRVHDFLNGLFIGFGIRCIQCNLKFGRIYKDEDFAIVLVDEITPDNCKLWDANTNEKLGIEGVLQNNEANIDSYKKIYDRLNV